MKNTLKAKREGTVIFLPKYVNAEMLMFEFFRNDSFTITPKINSDVTEYVVVQVHMHVDILDQLLDYINGNI